MKEKKITFKNNKEENFAGILYSPDLEGRYPIVIFCHGYRSTKDSSKVRPIAEKLTSKNICLLAFDLTNLGESDPKFAESTITGHIRDLKAAIDYCSLLTEKIGVIGSSLGGIISLQEAATDQRVKVIVEQCPVSIFPWKEVGDLAPDNVKEWKENGFIFTSSSRFGDLRINYSFYEDGLQYNDYSVYEKIECLFLVIHGTKDNSVPIESSKELIKHIKNSRLVVIEGADHRYSKKEDFDRMVEETANFFIENLK